MLALWSTFGGRHATTKTSVSRSDLTFASFHSESPPAIKTDWVRTFAVSRGRGPCSVRSVPPKLSFSHRVLRLARPSFSADTSHYTSRSENLMRARYNVYRPAAFDVETPVPRLTTFLRTRHFRSPLNIRAPAQFQDKYTVWSLRPSLYISRSATPLNRVVSIDDHSTVAQSAVLSSPPSRARWSRHHPPPLTHKIDYR